MARINKSFRLWAMIASVFALFNVAGLSAQAAPFADDATPPCTDCPDASVPVSDLTNLLRRHSDIL